MGCRLTEATIKKLEQHIRKEAGSISEEHMADFVGISKDQVRRILGKNKNSPFVSRNHLLLFCEKFDFPLMDEDYSCSEKQTGLTIVYGGKRMEEEIPFTGHSAESENFGNEREQVLELLCDLKQEDVMRVIVSLGAENYIGHKESLFNQCSELVKWAVSQNRLPDVVSVVNRLKKPQSHQANP
jgi:hypothetical protein